MAEDKKPKGIGKEEQLSKIAAAINPGSVSEANPTATQSMITTFVKYFESSALEIVHEMDDDQEKLINSMVDEITKLQTKNLAEFEKSIDKIVALTNMMMSSDNSKLKELGQGVQDKAKEELLSAKKINLSPENDTALNRLGARFNMDTEKTPLKGLTGVAKLAGGFLRDTKNQFKSGMKSAIGEGGLIDTIRTTDQQRKERELSRTEESAKGIETKSKTDDFKKLVEDILKQGKKDNSGGGEKPEKEQFQPIERLTDLTDDQKKALEKQGIAPASEDDISYRKEGKPVSIDQINTALSSPSSEQQEDTAGISKNASVEAITAIGASVAILESNSTESLDIFNKMLESLTKLSDWIEQNGNQLLEAGGGGGGGGGILDTVSKFGGKGMGSMLPSAGALATGAAVTAGVAGVAYGAYKGYTGYQEAKKQEETANAEIDQKVSRGELTQAQGLEAKDKTKKTGRVEKSKAVGQGAGIAAGAASGALLGATYGSALGPLGTAVGGVGGALVGGFVGGGGGKWLGEKAGQVTNWWKGDSDKASAIDEKVKKGEISKAEGDKLKKDLKPSGKDKVIGAAKATMGFVTNPLGTIGNALFGEDEKDKTKSTAAGAIQNSAKKVAKPETGRNVDGQIIEAGTAATKDKMQVNVPPPTVINQGGGGGGQSAPTITAPGGVGSVRSDDPTWLRFQQKRAIA